MQTVPPSKKKLDEIKVLNDKFASEFKDSAKLQMRVNLYQTHIRRFHQIMQEYNAASHDFRQGMQDRAKRRLKMVNKNLSEEQVEKIVDDGKAQEVIEQALVSDELEDVIQEIEERHQDVLKLERQVMEIYELFRDLAQLVDIQQDSLDVIETRVTNAKNYTEKAERELVEAEHYQTQARKRQCCILMIVLAVLGVILGPVLGTQLTKS